ncbi:MAG: efflux transporter periplasmic adaptor subunit, partial [Brachymonas denitrificans]
MKRNTLIGLAAAAALVLGGGYWMLQRSSVPASAPAASAVGGSAPAGKPALTVEVVHATRGSVPLTLGASGNITAWQEAIVGSQSNGLRLAELRANVGDWVKKGQVLAVFAADTVNA